MGRIIQDLGIVYKQPKLELEKGDDYEEKKNKIDRYKKISSALLKKRFYWDLKMKRGYIFNHT
jgi:hypothetical protein